MTDTNMPSRDQIKYAVQSVNAEHGWPMSFDLQDDLVDGIAALLPKPESDD
ncbi:hypothetical protein [Curtobacterium sp. MCSS17_006]|uniref:hypothetical protein n=1 Tax=Curtobacterium sp. MCSS17_006 TaxID=2175642 RepID=UPI0015E8D7E1|nr:hypothetical protein [Curtobacterium sp. MCSS17_006]